MVMPLIGGMATTVAFVPPWRVKSPVRNRARRLLDDLGRLGQAFREIDLEAAKTESVVSGSIAGQYCNPVQIVAFNTAEGWSRDVPENIAHEIQRRCDALRAAK
jgi:hypothetical protein